MIVDMISDLHGHFPKFEGGDLLIIAGDLTARDTRKEYDEFFDWFSLQMYRKKIFISGNHDVLLELGTYNIPKHCDCTYLRDSGTEFEGLKIWGTPWSLKFHGLNPRCAAFTGKESVLKANYDDIPNDIDILISHTPTYGILDQNMDGYLCGSRALRDTLDRVKPKLLVCGHIHEMGGQQLMYKHQGPNTWCVNASIVNERYEHVNKPVRVIL